MLKVRYTGGAWFVETIENILQENETPKIFPLTYPCIVAFGLTHDLRKSWSSSPLTVQTKVTKHRELGGDDQREMMLTSSHCLAGCWLSHRKHVPHLKQLVLVEKPRA